jgi:hypothetical protein
MGESHDASTTIGLLFTLAVTLADLLLAGVLSAATIRAYANRQILRRQKHGILAFIAAVLLLPLAILWVFYLRQ